MKVILTTNIKKLGKVGDQVNVKDGFARNFLFPNKMALRDTKMNIEHFEFHAIFVSLFCVHFCNSKLLQNFRSSDTKYRSTP